jgi:hypothetical protein
MAIASTLTAPTDINVLVVNLFDFMEELLCRGTVYRILSPKKAGVRTISGPCHVFAY